MRNKTHVLKVMTFSPINLAKGLVISKGAPKFSF